MNEELLYNQLYEKTKDCGRTQFVRLLMDKERENKKIKEQQKEFINYLKSMLNDDNDIFSVARVKDVLEKYKEIVGSDK